MAKSFHFLYWPRDLEERVLELLELRKKAGLLLDNEQRPLIIWEPAPLSCNKKQLSSLFSALKVVDVCSPNHLELLRLFGEQPSSPFSRAQVEDLARRIFDSGVGPRRTGTVVIRAGEHGAMTLNPHDGICHWIPPYYGSSLSPAEGESQSSGVVDATGAGNAFLGAYAIGYLKTGDIKEAACYGSVAASFVLEQRGMPRRKATDGQEKWNDSDVHDRLNTYLEQVFMSTHRR
ncbi:hypothetical protein UA08_03533 [Talaromyces atroroseus]|uniref:Carbohydrate kinase PfkB domain-containing protein n=1 Tax=Talaromyces atroroseus TaxID=1441469 RepID=A0A225AHB1_TALAT|nr:hypothetical protein UA08_03533 [Talaromyces atroroseus]OKL60801.1 hypothetical protein UA08_03533 [Talaromyces atroroseus]